MNTTHISVSIWAILVVAFTYLVYRLYKSKLDVPRWNRLKDCGIRNVLWKSIDDRIQVDEHDLAIACLESIILLEKHSPWSLSDITRGLNGIRILVLPTDKWNARFWDGHRIMKGIVTGQCSFQQDLIIVGPSFLAMCHEFAHMVEWSIDGMIDHTHTGWEVRGINKACRDFESTITASMLTTHRTTVKDQ